MIWDIMENRKIDNIPHQSEFNTWIARLTEEEINSIKKEINSRINGQEIATAGWIPGNEWEKTPFQPIYTKACGNNREASAKFFGLIVWVTFMEHPDKWGFGKYSNNNIPIKSMTYFKVTP